MVLNPYPFFRKWAGACSARLRSFSDWIAIGEFADTGERGGLEKSELLEDPSEDVPSAGVEEWTGIELSPSAARLGGMQGVLIPAAKVNTNAERKKLRDMWDSHLLPRGHSLLDSPAFALEWNADVQQIEEVKVPFEPIYRKTHSHLESYWKT